MHQLDGLAELTGMRLEWIQRMIHLRATKDPAFNKERRSLGFANIEHNLRREFGSDMNLNAEGLDFRWKLHIRPRLTKEDVRVKYNLETGAGPAQGSRGAVQPGSVASQPTRRDADRNQHRSTRNAVSNNASRSGPGAPYGGSQYAPGGSRQEAQFGQSNAFGAPQLGPQASSAGSQPGYGDPYPGPQPVFRGGPSGGPQFGGQYGAPQSNSGYPYQNIPGANQQASRAAISNSKPEPRGLPPTSSLIAVADGRRAPLPLQYNDPAPQETAPGAQEPLTWYRTGRAGEEPSFDQRYRFSREEREWLLNEGVYRDHGRREADQLYEDFRRQFSDHRVPSKRRVLEELRGMRSLD